jgi:hypothetical protein
MRAFAEWVSSRAYRSILVAALLGLLSAPLPLSAPLAIPSAGVVVLRGLRYGVRDALFVLASAATLVAIANAISGSDATIALVLVVGPWLPGAGGTSALTLVVGLWVAAAGTTELLRRSHSLSLCLQVAVLGIAALALLRFGNGDPVSQVQALLETMRADLEGVLQGPVSAETMAELARGLTAVSFGGAVVTLATSLLLGYWWETLVGDAPGTFAAQFRTLRMGRVLAVAFAAAVLAQGLTSAVIPDSLVCVLGVGFVLQGLAVLHTVAAAQGLSAGWIVALYVALFATMFYAATIIGLVGWLDTWLDLRRRLQGRRQGG